MCIGLESARSFGLKYYTTGRPCKRGHVGRRLTRSRECVACAESYDERNPSRKTYKSNYYRDNRQKLRETQRAYYQLNKDAFAASAARRKAENPEQFRKWARDYIRRNPSKHRHNTARRRAALIQRTPAWADLPKIAEFYREAVRLTLETGVPHHVDHIIPLQGKNVCGLHVHTNLRVIPAKQNIAKGNRFEG